MKRMYRELFRLSSLGLLALLSTQAHATGYRLVFQSPAVIAESGDAAAITDAGTNFYNSAGLTYLPQQLVLSATALSARTQFRGDVTAPNALFPANNYAASGTASSNTMPILPAIHYSLPVDCNKWFVGISIAPAWGFTEDYGDRSLLRYSVSRIYTKTILISPSVAWKYNDQWSFGLGPDFHYFSAISRVLVNTTFPGNTTDAMSRFSADAWGHGAHIGVMWQATPELRLGLNYRSKIVMDMDGYSSFDGQPALPYNQTSNFKLRLPLPPTTALSAHYDVTPCWAIGANIQYDQWSVIKAYYASNYAQPTGSTNVTLPQDFSNAWDVGVGTHFRYDDQWTFRGSMNYVGTPTKNSLRSPVFPDEQKLGVQVGLRYKYNCKLSFDAVLGHVWVKDASINDVNPVTLSTATGNSSTSLNFLGASLVWTI